MICVTVRKQVYDLWWIEQTWFYPEINTIFDKFQTKYSIKLIVLEIVTIDIKITIYLNG